MDQDINIEHYNYLLPDERIAKFPLEERSRSKLLLWKKGIISHEIFEGAPNHLPPDSLLVFNDTKVIAARLLFQKATGALIELFLLHPEQPTRDIAISMTVQETCVWSCMIGNKKKWKEGELVLSVGGIKITASYHDRESNLIRFDWTGKDTFADLINTIGETPLPPYLKRKPNLNDASRYQTVYSKNDGAVAAPTAGLHFTPSILDKIKEQNIGLEYLTLHVSAGTFKPVEANDYRNHEMHCEQMVIAKESIENLLSHHNKLIAVGTTSLRILESLYWYGVLLDARQDAPFFIDKNTPYNPELASDISFDKSLTIVLSYMAKKQLTELHGETEIFIYPGYEIKTAHGLFTNFHLPKSTLLLLVSAFTNGAWKQIYSEASAKGYRFLSYGDSSLLLR